MSNNRKKLIKKLDAVFSKFIRARDKKSVLSGSTENLVCSHVFSRVSHSTRWSKENCFAMTNGENLRHEYYPNYINTWFINKYGLEKFELLHLLSHTTTKFSEGDLKVMINYYSEKLYELKEQEHE